MSGDRQTTYPPLNTPKPLAENVWVVDGPAIRFGLGWLKLSFPTRMTLLRLADGGLFLHSPTALSDTLRAEIGKLGPPRWIVAPNRIHYWWVPDWHAAFPEAEVYLAPRVREQAGGRIDFPARELEAAQGYPWDGEIATLPIPGSYMTEVVFFHRPSRSLVLTDLIENFEPRKLGFVMRRLTRWAAIQDPDGQMPRDMRLTFKGRRAELRRAVETMIAWDPQRIILAHGRCYDRDGAGELRRAFRWLLD
ncbi:DUF4336 domain-containing protein [Pelagibius marinus]|uniref:DUF4336 domain-containing protein n=1 Tax=Pelagibius marinus TaxID=2762760 RepID=UPI001872F4C2|nr:DUF4336 domain-containing protein [Pelagibius marinus]